MRIVVVGFLLFFAFCEYGLSQSVSGGGNQVPAQYQTDFGTLRNYWEEYGTTVLRSSDPAVPARAFAEVQFQVLYRDIGCVIGSDLMIVWGPSSSYGLGPNVGWPVRCTGSGAAIVDWVGGYVRAVCDGGATPIPHEGPWVCSGALQIALAGPSETKPRGTGNWRDLTLTATVKQGTQAIAGKAVIFKIVPKQAADGHLHALTGKPTGTIANGATNAAGELRSPYLPSEFAGVYTIEASCDGCSNKATLDVTVRVPELISLPPDTSATSRYKLVGSTATHADSHYLSKAAGIALENLLTVFETVGWGELGINDASLPWGGRFDVGAHWAGSHYEHREGDEVDISFRNPSPVGADKRQKVYDDLRKAERFTTPQVLWHQFDNLSVPSYAHFHVYLLGQNMSQQIPN